jgi:hypothetical protein
MPLPTTLPIAIKTDSPPQTQPTQTHSPFQVDMPEVNGYNSDQEHAGDVVNELVRLANLDAQITANSSRTSSSADEQSAASSSSSSYGPQATPTETESDLTLAQIGLHVSYEYQHRPSMLQEELAACTQITQFINRRDAAGKQNSRIITQLLRQLSELNSEYVESMRARQELSDSEARLRQENTNLTAAHASLHINFTNAQQQNAQLLQQLVAKQSDFDNAVLVAKQMLDEKEAEIRRLVAINSDSAKVSDLIDKNRSLEKSMREKNMDYVNALARIQELETKIAAAQQPSSTSQAIMPHAAMSSSRKRPAASLFSSAAQSAAGSAASERGTHTAPSAKRSRSRALPNAGAGAIAAASPSPRP